MLVVMVLQKHAIDTNKQIDLSTTVNRGLDFMLIRRHCSHRSCQKLYLDSNPSLQPQPSSHGSLRQACRQEDSRLRRFVRVRPYPANHPFESFTTNTTSAHSIGFGAAEILLEAGAHVIAISSSEERVQDAVGRLNSPNAVGRVADVRDEAATTQLLLSLAPLDHVVFSAVDKIIRGPLADADLDGAKHLFGVKFWGSIVVAKG